MADGYYTYPVFASLPIAIYPYFKKVNHEYDKPQSYRS